MIIDYSSLNILRINSPQSLIIKYEGKITMDYICLLAQAGVNEPLRHRPEPVNVDKTSTKTTASDPNIPARPKGPFGEYGTFILLGLMFVMFYVLLFRGPRKKQQQHKQMVQELGKNDRVRTIGGIIGTVVDIKGDEITLKVDESNNTKIRVVKDAIGKNLSKEKSADSR